MPRPNILWLIVDHMAFAGHYRQHLAHYYWPHLEQLAAGGAWYERAYTTVPVCTPARASLLTGQRPGRHGMRWNPEYRIAQNRTEFHADQRLFNHRLADVGYRSTFVGKWHCGRSKLPEDYGMDGWSLADYGNVYGSDVYKAHLQQLGIAQPKVRVEHNLFRPDWDGQTFLLDPPEPWTFMDGCGVVLGDERAQEQFFVADQAVNALETLSADAASPWCLVASFWGPHHPYLPSESFAAKIDPKDIDIYPTFAEDLRNKPWRYRVHRDLRCDFRAHQRWPDWSVWQTLMARCYAQGLQTDAALARVLAALEASGEADNTLVVVCSDHGDAIASHGAGWDKYSTYTEEVGRIPLVMRWPGTIAAGARKKTPVSSLDITATILAAAGADCRELDGRDLLQLDDTQAASQALVVEHYGHSGDVAFQRIVYLDDWKYVAAWGDDDELYDLTDDPYEKTNRIDDPQAAKRLRQLRLIARDDLRAERTQRAAAHPYSEMEHKLVVSSALWPREERLLLYKLEQACE